jgi:RNA polymerase sigma-70 factor (ECF subfamily)
MELERVAAGPSSHLVIGLYDANQADLHGYALAITHDAGLAEDVVQEAFLRLVRQHHAGQPPHDPRAWLFRVATNLIRSGFRRRSVAERHEPVMYETDAVESAETSVVRSEDRRALRAALATLPVDVRMALMLSAEGYSGREVARLLGKREGATRTLLWRGRLELRRVLDGEADR